ncbi:MAG: DegT/DnrJ/EryC1/StrS family aminotransferase, partial [Lachnospiraceae bacterium]|nr:DegT/DnrJ/EryC1/StrS family aminotransferase [Lachnospiraceae bacterium]
RHYQHSQIGYNYRMSNIVAGIGRGQLLHLEEHKALKKAIYSKYKEAFSDISEISLNPLNKDGDANCWLSCMCIDPACGVTPGQVMDALEAENIECRPIWKPMHLQPVFEGYDFITQDGSVKDHGNTESVSAEIFEHGLCLPSDIKNTDADMDRIIGIVRRCFGR